MQKLAHQTLDANTRLMCYLCTNVCSTYVVFGYFKPLHSEIDHGDNSIPYVLEW